MKKKVFIIGSHKTGTTSLEQCLKILGYKIFPTKLSYDKNGLIYDLEKGDFDKIFNVAKNYEGFDDSPWNHGDFYKKLDNHFKDSLFILSVRDTENWINSNLRWDRKINLRKFHWYNSVSKTVYQTDSFLDDMNKTKEVYENRNKEVIEYFKDRNNLLVIDLEKDEGWNELCAFLKCGVPNKPFPHLNKTK